MVYRLDKLKLNDQGAIMVYAIISQVSDFRDGLQFIGDNPQQKLNGKNKIHVADLYLLLNLVCHVTL